MRHLFIVALAVTGFLVTSLPAQAQLWAQPYPSPWYPQPYYPPIYRPNPGIQYLGNLPNGIPVFNPWNMYNNQNYSGMAYQPYVYNPYVYNPYLNGGLGYNPYASNPFNPGGPHAERELGRFVPVARDLAINPLTGTRLAPYRGIALTNEGAFYRIPGTGSITAWGALVPGSGEYYNPVNGTLYNPGSGIIVRP